MPYTQNIYSDYKDLISLYLSGKKKDAINECHYFCERMIKLDSGPDEIVQIHIDAIEDLELTDVEDVKDSLSILREVHNNLGVSFKDYREMARLIESHDKELEVASQLQDSMLKTTIPKFDAIDLGVLSVPANKVSGDYFNIIDHYDGMLSFGVADVIGKGIPAALAMSMIKFSMDSYGYSQYPSDSLRKLNRVVEKNINQNMFITMFYGMYDTNTNLLYYSSAGHEPALVYRYATDTFEAIDTKGIVLGIKKLANFEQRQVKLAKDDLLIVFTDGISEMRKRDDTIIDFSMIEKMIRECKDEHPQDIVQYIYETLIPMTHPRKKDDITLFILKNLH